MTALVKLELSKLNVILHHSHDLIFCLCFTPFFLILVFALMVTDRSHFPVLCCIALCSAGDLVTVNSVTQAQGMSGFWETAHKICCRYMH